MIEWSNETDTPFDPALVEPIYRELATQDLELLLVDDDAIASLNRDYRGKEGPTDVLSFPVEPFPEAPLGSIVISVDTAARQADNEGHDLETELKVLFLHGLLHLLGYDHETDGGEMAAKEKKLREHFGLPAALTERNQ